MADNIAVTENTEQQRYDISVDGEHAGFSAYRDTEQAGTPQRILHHTEIQDKFNGRGLASTLTREAIAKSVESGRRIVPLCPYVKNWTTKHEDFADWIDTVSSTHLELF